jgi:hypothetical protein
MRRVADTSSPGFRRPVARARGTPGLHGPTRHWAGCCGGGLRGSLRSWVSPGDGPVGCTARRFRGKRGRQSSQLGKDIQQLPLCIYAALALVLSGRAVDRRTMLLGGIAVRIAERPPLDPSRGGTARLELTAQPRRLTRRGDPVAAAGGQGTGADHRSSAVARSRPVPAAGESANRPPTPLAAAAETPTSSGLGASHPAVTR